VPNAAAAERILTLVTTPDRAAATVGDLLEDARGQRPVWFWAGVLETACSSVWRDLCISPRQMVCLGFWGWLLAVCLAAAVAWTVIPLWMAAFPYHPQPNSTYIPPWGLIALRVVTLTAVPLAAGWDVASRSKNREVAGGVMTTIVLALFTLTWTFLSAMQVRRIGKAIPGIENAVPNLLVSSLFFISGSVLFRFRSLRRVANPPGRSVREGRPWTVPTVALILGGIGFTLTFLVRLL
jgi:hypothetical protein